MGTHNRERRRAKKSARAKSRRDANRADWGRSGRAATPPPFRSSWPEGDNSYRATSQRESVAALIHQAAHAVCDGRSDRDDQLARLIRAEFGTAGRLLVADELDASILDLEAVLLLNGWEPLDLWEAGRRRAGTVGTRLLAGLLRPAVILVSDSSELAAREAQCAAIEVTRRLDPSSSEWPADVTAAVGLVGMLYHLPSLMGLEPSDVTGKEDPDFERGAVLSKIRRLLAKAESTEFTEEADACTAKATGLMHRHRIDRAAVEASTGVSRVSGITSRRCWIDAPYVDAKSLLLDVVAGANGCKAVYDELGFVTVVGSVGDLEMTELLFTSLLVQATHQMTIAGATTAAQAAAAREQVAATLDFRAAVAEAPGGDEVDVGAVVDRLQSFFAASITKRKRNPSFRRSFLVAYATRIERRFGEAERNITDAATAELGPTFLPVLARQQRCVEEAVQRIFGELSHSRIRVTDRAGWAAGTAAADLANLNVRGEFKTG
jgi:hypothetical protein